ncbi:hypothetical protein [Amaricoccus sp.]|uniref:hypothetical protein n=1 Tax=Amaricoccus sp. TaxID=1872485 RepID=UPI00263378E8|nr:hypothetical protein [Amaricoccus sp.]
MRITGIAACLVAGTAAAQGIAPEGAFTINFTSLVVNGEPTIEIGPDRRTGLYEGVLTASNAEGKGLLHNLTGHCLGKFEIDTGSGTFEQHGHCVYTDADGHRIWEQFDFEPQPLAPVQMAAGRWIGGSGKYEGLRGEFEIRVRPLRPATEGFGQVIGSKQGSYRISAPN